MIFVTIGTQEPFDRLVKAIDEIVPVLDGMSIIAQVSKSKYNVRHMKTFDFISPTEFNKYFNDAKLIVAHAGMGTIISALEKEKPIIVMPRLVQLGEHRNDHQIATAKKFEALNYINVAYDEQTLKEKVIQIAKNDLKHLHRLGDQASNELINSVRNFYLK